MWCKIRDIFKLIFCRGLLKMADEYQYEYQYEGKIVKVDLIYEGCSKKIFLYVSVNEDKLLGKDKKCLPLLHLDSNNENLCVDCKCFKVEKEDDKYLLKVKLNNNFKDYINALLIAKKVKITFECKNTNEELEIKTLELYGSE